MTTALGWKSPLRRVVGTVAFVAVLAALALVFRKPLAGWFSGKPEGSASKPLAVQASAAGAPASLDYPPAAFDSLRAALDAYDRIRSALARDELAPIVTDARTLGEALGAAAAAIPNERRTEQEHGKAAARLADTLARSPTLEQARKDFAELNRELLPLILVDARLGHDWHIFECAMFEGRPRWMQPAAPAENPYMGKKMPSCGAEQPRPTARNAQQAGAPPGPGEIDHYTCSMHPQVRQAGPGKCPICGMDLVPVTKEQQAAGVVMVDETRRQLIGVRTAPVIEAPMRSAIRAVGKITYDESTIVDVNLKVQGWITKLAVSRTGQRVTRGQTLFTLYSPELYNAQQDFLLATRGGSGTTLDGGSVRGDSFGKAARQRLHLLGLGKGQIDAIQKKGTPSENVAFGAPTNGFVIEKNAVEGASVEPGTRLYRIAALSKVWVEADVYEADFPRVRVGQTARVTLDYLPGETYEAKVGYVYPYLDPKTRTGSVRIELANKELDLRPGMYANVELGSDLGNRVQVQSGAVIYTGPRRLVFVDLGQGRFKPQEVRLGAQSSGMYEVLEGLKPGDIVATSGVFLLAAEARISTAAKYWESASEPPDAGASPTPAASVSPPPSPSSTAKKAPRRAAEKDTLPKQKSP